MGRRGGPAPVPSPPLVSRETLERTRSALERQPFRHATANETFAAIRELDIALGDACPRCAPVYTVAKAKVTQ